MKIVLTSTTPPPIVNSSIQPKSPYGPSIMPPVTTSFTLIKDTHEDLSMHLLREKIYSSFCHQNSLAEAEEFIAEFSSHEGTILVFVDYPVLVQLKTLNSYPEVEVILPEHISEESLGHLMQEIDCEYSKLIKDKIDEALETSSDFDLSVPAYNYGIGLVDSILNQLCAVGGNSEIIINNLSIIRLYCIQMLDSNRAPNYNTLSIHTYASCDAPTIAILKAKFEYYNS